MVLLESCCWQRRHSGSAIYSTPLNYPSDDWRKKVMAAVLVPYQGKVSMLLMASTGFSVPVWLNQVLKVHWVQISASSCLSFRQRQNNPWSYWTEIGITPYVWAKLGFCQKAKKVAWRWIQFLLCERLWKDSLLINTYNKLLQEVKPSYPWCLKSYWNWTNSYRAIWLVWAQYPEEIFKSFLQTPQLKTLNELGSHALNTPVLRVNKASSPGLVNVNCLTKAPLLYTYSVKRKSYQHFQIKRSCQELQSPKETVQDSNRNLTYSMHYYRLW